MEKKIFLKEFVNSIQLKISIAAALVVIRTKPAHRSAEEHAKIIQAQYLNYWKNVESKVDNDFEDKIISLQQSKICNFLLDIVPPVSAKNSVGWDEFVGINLNTSLLESQDSDSECEFELGNAEFVHSIIRLKYAVDSKNALAVSKVQNVTRNILQLEARATETEEDSGFESFKKSVETVSDQTISSNIFRPITHSSDTEFLITKSVELVLKYVHKQIMINPEESFMMWEGSILEHMCSILKSATVIGNFVQI